MENKDRPHLLTSMSRGNEIKSTEIFTMYRLLIVTVVEVSGARAIKAWCHQAFKKAFFVSFNALIKNLLQYYGFRNIRIFYFVK